MDPEKKQKNCRLFLVARSHPPAAGHRLLWKQTALLACLAGGCGEREASGQRVTWALVSQVDLAKLHNVLLAREPSRDRMGRRLLQGPPCWVAVSCLGRRLHCHSLPQQVCATGHFLAGELLGTGALSLHWAQSSS